MVRDINLDLYEGEIVGIAGLMGAGRTETTRAIFGVDAKESGEITLDGKEVFIKKPEDAIKAGIVLAPEDRKKDGLCTKLSVTDNIALPNLDMICNRMGIINIKKQDKMTSDAVFNLKMYLVSAVCSFLVGIITCATAGMGTMDAGNAYEMYAVAASVIGGVFHAGWPGYLLGTVVGASIWGVLQNGLQFAGAPVAIRNIVIGVIVVVSVLLDVIIRTGKLKKKNR